MNQRKIIHVDMDAFYASIEQRDHPEYRGKPIAVGRPEMRGVVAAASYEARRFGVRSAMPSMKALKLCPHLIFTRNRMDVYKAVSAQIHFYAVTVCLSKDQFCLICFFKNNLISLVTRLGKNGSFVSCRLHPETVCQITRCKKHSIACVLWKHQFYIECIREEIVILIF